MATDITPTVWVLNTKRGWGMLIVGATGFVNFISPIIEQYTGIKIDAPMLATIGDVGQQVIEHAAYIVGGLLMVWGMFRPTGDLSIKKP